MRRRNANIGVYQQSTVAPERESRRERGVLSEAIQEEGNRSFDKAAQATGTLAGTKQEVDNFNRNEKYRVAQANKQKNQALTTALVGLVIGGATLGVGLAAAGAAGAAASAASLSTAATTTAGVSQATGSAATALAASTAAKAATLGVASSYLNILSPIATPALSYLANGGQNPGLVLGGAALASFAGLFPTLSN